MKTPEQVEAVLAYCRSRTHCVEGVEWAGEAIAENAVKRHILRLLGESDLQVPPLPLTGGSASETIKPASGKGEQP